MSFQYKLIFRLPKLCKKKIMSHTRSKIILIVFIMVISLKEYETAKGGSDSESGGSDSESGGWDSYSESSAYDKYSSRHLSRMRGRSSFNDLAESSSSRPRSFSAEEPISIEDIPKTCNGWIMFGLYQHKSIWRVGYWNYTAKYGDMRSDDFCNKFGDNVPTTKYLTTEESTKPCYGWIDFVGYHLEDSGVEKNKIIAELRNKKKLDLFISDWPFKYSLFLLDPSNKILLTPIQYCSQILGYNGDHLTPKSADHELLKQQHLSD